MNQKHEETTTTAHRAEATTYKRKKRIEIKTINISKIKSKYNHRKLDTEKHGKIAWIDTAASKLTKAERIIFVFDILCIYILK